MEERKPDDSRSFFGKIKLIKKKKKRQSAVGRGASLIRRVFVLLEIFVVL